MVDGYARFIESSLKTGNVVIVVVTESHRARLLPRLEADGVDVAAAMEHRRYIPLDAVDTLSRLMVNDAVRCTKVIGDQKGTTGRVSACGGIAPTLLSRGKGKGRLSSNHFSTRSREAMGYRLCVAICPVRFQIKELTRSSKESARNTLPRMDENCVTKLDCLPLRSLW